MNDACDDCPFAAFVVVAAAATASFAKAAAVRSRFSHSNTDDHRRSRPMLPISVPLFASSS